PPEGTGPAGGSPPPARTDRWETSRLRTARAPGPVRAAAGPRVPAPGRVHREGARAPWPLQPARRGGRTPTARETAPRPLETPHSGEWPAPVRPWPGAGRR